MTNKAQIVTRDAPLWGEFGLKLAGRYFAEGVIAELPRFKKGKYAGQIKARIVWVKVQKGGWVGQGVYAGDTPVGYVENRVGKVIEAKLIAAEWMVPNEQQEVYATWQIGQEAAPIEPVVLPGYIYQEN